MSSPSSTELLAKLKDPKYYLEQFCKIKTKDRGLAPFILNEAQKDLFNALRTSNRVIILKARQMGFCQHPSTKILTADLEWIEIDNIAVGQEIISVDEFSPGGKGPSRKMRTAIVEAKSEVFDEAYKLTMDDGRVLVLTGSHKMLSMTKGGDYLVWKKAEEMHVGDGIRYITKPWETERSYEDGWFGGMIDGEGCLHNKEKSSVKLTVSQISGPVWDRLKKYLSDNKYNFTVDVDRRVAGSSSKLGSKEVNKVVIGKMDELFRLLGSVGSARFKGTRFWEGRELPNIGWSKVVSIELLPAQRMIDLQTSEKTYIAEGFVSHNSTAVTGYYYHKTITTPGVNTALIGYNSELTTELLDKVKTFYRTTPDSIKPKIQYNSKFEISFPAIDSKIIVLPSTENVGRGYTLHNVLSTELSAWDKAEEKMSTLEASVPINGQIIVESTPRGQGNLYHRMWMSDNDYVKKEYGWWWHYSEEEIEIIKRRMNNPSKFAQEYGLEFLTSGRSVFDPNSIQRQRKNQLAVGDLNTRNSIEGERVREVDGLRIYSAPRSDHFYIVGADVAEGVDGGDYSVAMIWDRMTGEEVAFFRGHTEPDKFADKLNGWGRMFNNALMVVEINNHGLTTVTCLKKLLYPSMYFRPTHFEKIASPWSEKLGWKTTKLTRPLMIDDFAQAVRDNELIIHSKEVLDEMTVFVYDRNNNMVAQEGFHDDCIFSGGIGFQGFKVMYDKPLDQINYAQYLPTSGY